LSISASGVGRPLPAARRVPVSLVAVLGVVVLAAIGYLAAGDRIRALLQPAAPTPIPEGIVEPAAASDAGPAGDTVPPPVETPAEPARPTPARREVPATAVPAPAVAVPTVEPTAVPPTPTPIVEPAPTEPPVEAAPAAVVPAATVPPPPTMPRTRAGDLVDIGLVDTRPVAISRPDPVYPETAKRTRAGGQVTLRALVNERGTVDRVEVVSSARRDLAVAATTAARQYRYTPAIKDGVPVKVWVPIVLNFTLAPAP
jgi:protein TonB